MKTLLPKGELANGLQFFICNNALPSMLFNFLKKLLKTFWEKEKMLVTSIFSFSQFFYSIKDDTLICNDQRKRFYEIGRSWNYTFGEGLQRGSVDALHRFVCLGFFAVSTVVQLFNSESSQIHVSWTNFNQYLTSPLTSPYDWQQLLPKEHLYLSNTTVKNLARIPSFPLPPAFPKLPLCNQFTFIWMMSPTTALKLYSGISHFWFPVFSILPLVFHFWVPCLVVTSNTSPGHNLAKPAIPRNTKSKSCQHFNQWKLNKYTVLKIVKSNVFCLKLAFSHFPLMFSNLSKINFCC